MIKQCKSKSIFRKGGLGIGLIWLSIITLDHKTSFWTIKMMRHNQHPFANNEVLFYTKFVSELMLFLGFALSKMHKFLLHDIVI